MLLCVGNRGLSGGQKAICLDRERINRYAGGMQGLEIMAPAGSFESLAAALRAGADSVYFGVGMFNMRARSSVNFTVEDLPKVAR